jgi:hypothetical protein
MKVQRSKPGFSMKRNLAHHRLVDGACKVLWHVSRAPDNRFEDDADVARELTLDALFQVVLADLGVVIFSRKKGS